MDINSLIENLKAQGINNSNILNAIKTILRDNFVL